MSAKRRTKTKSLASCARQPPTCKFYCSLAPPHAFFFPSAMPSTCQKFCSGQSREGKKWRLKTTRLRPSTRPELLWFKFLYLSPPYTLPICQGGLQRCLKLARTVLTCHCRFCFALRLLPLHCRLFADMADEESDGEEYESGRCCTLCRREHLTRLRFLFSAIFVNRSFLIFRFFWPRPLTLCPYRILSYSVLLNFPPRFPLHLTHRLPTAKHQITTKTKNQITTKTRNQRRACQSLISNKRLFLCNASSANYTCPCMLKYCSVSMRIVCRTARDCKGSHRQDYTAGPLL